MVDEEAIRNPIRHNNYTTLYSLRGAAFSRPNVFLFLKFLFNRSNEIDGA